MICPHCKFEQPDENEECAKCGIIFSKYASSVGSEGRDRSRSTKTPAIGEKSAKFPFFDWLQDLLFYVEPETNVFFFGGRVILYLVLLIYGFRFIFTSMEESHTVMPFMHLVNLPFHEAGHIIFMPLGRFMMFLGGTLAQLLMPLICMAALLITSRNTFGASASLWWVGQNFMDIAPYINDSRALKLILLGGVTGREVDGHDWENILGTLGWRQYDHVIAHISYSMGIILMIVSCIWGGYILYWQFKNVDVMRK
ncbi:MAG: zinc ribbon domain-containing protein [Proteobacteria bacterium]|nr:zinc ribbon domain-containing protein [Pseudomonadota bacterium]